MVHNEALAAIIVRSCIAICIVSLTRYCWQFRGDMATPHQSLKALILKLASVPSMPLNDRFCKELDKARVARCKYFIDVLQVPITISFLVHLLLVSSTGPCDWSLAFTAVYMFARHVAYLCYKCYIETNCFSVSHIQVLFKVVMLAGAIRIYLADTDLFLMNGGLRCGLRMVNAVLLLDWQTAVRWNAFLSAIVGLSIWGRLAELCVDGRSPRDVFIHHFVTELAVCVCVCAVAVLLEAGERHRIIASLESSQSGRSYRATQRLLSVFCDAQLQICPQSSIVAHSPHLLHLLAPRDGKDETRSTLQGESFVRYVEESDRQRFQDFISATAVRQSEDALLNRFAASPGEHPKPDEHTMGPATSIQVSLRKEGGGHPTPVELFLIPVADVDDAPEYLMGIREAQEALPLEAYMDAPDAVPSQLRAAGASAREAALGPLAGERHPPKGLSLGPAQGHPPLPLARAPAVSSALLGCSVRPPPRFPETTVPVLALVVLEGLFGFVTLVGRARRRQGVVHRPAAGLRDQGSPHPGDGAEI
ncbi:unnamed protein product [Prorocentrum cordatum]|uniref:Uncharacterized protein n=1 Tax=Prorocentrum cordatum TaxID=2364126 RepID=A0ABN9Y0M3_9DINO|nr:unnamed protein product [Polarella glacialis]